MDHHGIAFGVISIRTVGIGLECGEKKTGVRREEQSIGWILIHAAIVVLSVSKRDGERATATGSPLGCRAGKCLRMVSR